MTSNFVSRSSVHRAVFCLFVSLILLRISPTIALAQEYHFYNPIWHPQKDIIAVTNGRYLRFYSGDFSQLIDEYTLIADPEAIPRVPHMAWSPDGTMIAVGIIGDGVLSGMQVWDFETDQQIMTQPRYTADTLFFWGPQSDQLAMINIVDLGRNTIQIYNMPGGELAQEIDPETRISTFAWYTDSDIQHMALNLFGEKPGLYFWNSKSGDFTLSPLYLLGSISETLTYSPDGSKLAGLQQGHGTDVTIVDADSYEVIGSITDHTDRIIRVIWNDNAIITVSLDGTIRFWDPNTYEQIDTLQTDHIYSISFSPDGSRFVTEVIDNVAVCDAQTGEVIATLYELAD